MKKIFKIDNLKDKKIEYLLFVSAFLFFIFMAMYKLTDAPLWLDEAWEFYFSKVISGTIPGISRYHNLYERLINDSFQPPLYNLIMFVWLQFGESEWWFRFAGVIIGAIGVVGLYKSMKRISNQRIACLSIVIYSCIYQAIYYIQECAEYSLLVMFLMWTLYYYIVLMEEARLKNMILFVLFCILSMYTQYGAIFVLLPLAVSLVIKMIMDKNWASLKKMLGIYASSILAAGLPLILFFFLPQLSSSNVTYTKNAVIKLYRNNIFADHLQMFLDVFRWNTIESMTRFYALSLIASVILGILAIYCLKFGKSKILKHLIVCNIVTWISYYILARLEMYAYGYFGARYNIFFIPLWIITIIWMLSETYRTFEYFSNVKVKKIVQYGFRGIMVIVAVGYCIYGSHQILKHWEKSDTRGAVNIWYEQEGYHVTTLVEFGQAKSFTYYLEHDDRYKESYTEKIYREMDRMVKAEDDYEQEYQDYITYLDSILGTDYPDELYYFIGDGERSQVLRVLADMGYSIEERYRTTAGLYYIHK